MGNVPPPNTPPLLLYPFWALGWLYQQLFSPLFPPTWLNDPPILRFMLRLPALAATCWRRRSCACHGGARRAVALTAAGFYLFNPALIFDSAYWGQTAALHTLWMLLAIIAASLASFGWAGVALALAVLTKPQALAIAPLVLLLAWRERGLFGSSARVRSSGWQLTCRSSSAATRRVCCCNTCRPRSITRISRSTRTTFGGW